MIVAVTAGFQEIMLLILFVYFVAVDIGVTLLIPLFVVSRIHIYAGGTSLLARLITFFVVTVLPLFRKLILLIDKILPRGLLFQ